MIITPQDTKITLIGNPFAGKWAEDNIKMAYDILKDKGFQIQLKTTQYKGHAEEMAKEIVMLNSKDGINNLVISAGGDGTYNEVANGLVNSGIPMAILPMGTTSVLAIELKIPNNINDAIESILNGAVIEINTGIVEFFRDGKEMRRHFLLMAGVGYDAETVRCINSSYKKTVGKLAYIYSGIEVFLKHRGHIINATIHKENGISKACTCSNIIIGKGAHYGGHFRVTPDASLIEPSFYYFLTYDNSRLALLKYVYGIVSHRHLGFRDIEYGKADSISLDGDAPIQIDGDYIGNIPAKIRIGQKALRIVVRKDL
ncbi:MAG: diacylglycerol kinase family protein [Thermodesulfovibrionales bacterium]|nr:diacylglycerol kinase family protein [Thermodesulfovibrionales bacterium]